MDRTKAIELLKKALGCVQTDPRNCGECKKCENYATEEDGIEAIRMAITALEKAETNCPEIPNSWVPCSKKMPKVGSDVLITKEPLKIKGYEQEVIIAKRSVDPRSGKIEWWSEFGALKDKSVLAWMPLPEPWKGERDDSD